MKKIQNKGLTGFTLIETLVAITILTLGIVGPLELAYKSISYTKLSQNKITASYLAQEGMELVRYIRDTNKINSDPWLRGLANCKGSSYCRMDAYSVSVDTCGVGPTCHPIQYSDSQGYNYTVGNPTIFTRNINIVEMEAYEAKISVSVVWNERIGQKRIDLEENIYNIP